MSILPDGGVQHPLRECVDGLTNHARAVRLVEILLTHHSSVGELALVVLISVQTVARVDEALAVEAGEVQSLQAHPPPRVRKLCSVGVRGIPTTIGSRVAAHHQERTDVVLVLICARKGIRARLVHAARHASGETHVGGAYLVAVSVSNRSYQIRNDAGLLVRVIGDRAA